MPRNIHEPELDLKTKYDVSNALLQQLPQEFIELMRGIPFESDLFKRMIENS